MDDTVWLEITSAGKMYYTRSWNDKSIYILAVIYTNGPKIIRI